MNNSYTFSFLSEQDIPALYATFLEAFADYIMPIKISREEFAIKFRREGVEPTFCAGAYAGSKLVGFIITGLGEWQGKPTAYNAGTGVLPAHRGHRLTQQLYDFMLPKLRQSGIEQCLLEVISANKPALKSYEAVGFKPVRSLFCFRSPVQSLLLPHAATGQFIIKASTQPDWKTFTSFWDISPSWQNTKTAFSKSSDEKIVLEASDAQGALMGYAAFFPRTGAIAQLAVHPEYRRQGVGTALLKEVVKQLAAPALLFINVDTANPVMLEFLERRHFTRFLVQQEMLLPLC